MLFTVKGGKFKLSAHGQDLAPFFGNVTKVKIPSKIKLPLVGIRSNLGNFHANIITQLRVSA